MMLVIRGGIEVRCRLRALGRLLRRLGDAVGVQRLAAEGLLDPAGTERDSPHVREPDADVLADVPGLLDERADRNHGPVFAAPVELLVPEAPAVPDRESHLRELLI